MRVVPPLDKGEYFPTGVRGRRERVLIHALALQRREEALAQGVVAAITHRAHRALHLGLGTARPKHTRGVLAALVGVMNHADRLALFDSHREGVGHQLRGHLRPHRPAHDPAAEHIQDHRKVQRRAMGVNVGNVRHSQPVRRRGAKVSLNAVRAGRGRRLANGRTGPAASAHALNPSDPHEARDAVDADIRSPLAQIFGDPRGAIGPAGALMEEPDAFGQALVLDGSVGGPARLPGIESAARYLKHGAHEFGGKGGLVLLYEREEPSGVSVVS